jgi:hypothetical protein
MKIPNISPQDLQGILKEGSSLLAIAKAHPERVHVEQEEEGQPFTIQIDEDLALQWKKSDSLNKTEIELINQIFS